MALGPQEAPAPVQSSKLAVMPGVRQVKKTLPAVPKALITPEQFCVPQSVPKGVQAGAQVPAIVVAREAPHFWPLSQLVSAVQNLRQKPREQVRTAAQLSGLPIMRTQAMPSVTV